MIKMPTAWAFPKKDAWAVFLLSSENSEIWCLMVDSRLGTVKNSLKEWMKRMTMALYGRPLAEQMKAEVIHEVQKRKALGQVPKIVTLLVEGDPASVYYARAKRRQALKLGIEFSLLRFPSDISEDALRECIRQLNNDSTVHGIMVELPLPNHIQADAVIETISPVKDVDGLTPTNRHANLSGDVGLFPATPIACVRLVEHYGYQLSGKHVVLVGCGKTVGMPLFHLLLRKNATVTVCHAGTQNVRGHLASAQIAFVAVGKAGLITPDMVHKGLVIVDAGINETMDDQIVGDVEPEVDKFVAALSPTPGGVGPVTTMQLFTNLISAMDLQMNAINVHFQVPIPEPSLSL